MREDELPSGELIVALSKHLTCVKDGVLYDTYDCSRGGDRCVYGYWRKPKAKAKKEPATSKQYPEALLQKIEEMTRELARLNKRIERLERGKG